MFVFDDGDVAGTEDERALVMWALDDPAAFQRLYERYFRRVYSYVAARVDDQHDAEDIVSDVFLRVVRNLNQLRNAHHISFAAWVFTIARNAVTDHHRRKPQREALVSLESAPPVSTDSSHDTGLIDHENAAQLRRLIAALPERKREIITLKYYGGLRNQDIAALLHIRERTVGGTLSRALDELHQKYIALNPETER